MFFHLIIISSSSIVVFTTENKNICNEKIVSASRKTMYYENLSGGGRKNGYAEFVYPEIKTIQKKKKKKMTVCLNSAILCGP